MMARVWLITCPECGNRFEAASQQVEILCGRAVADCTCPQCEHKFRAEQDYLLWLGVEGPMPPEIVG